MMVGLIMIVDVTIIVMTMRFCQHCGHIIMPIVSIRGIISILEIN